MVAEVGRGVTTVKEGDKVSAEMHVACGKCMQCRIGEAHICQHVRILGVDADGAFASYAIIPETNIWKLSPTIPHDYASLLDPLGNAVHTVLAGPIARADRGGDGVRGDRAVFDCRGQGLRSGEGVRDRG